MKKFLLGILASLVLTTISFADGVKITALPTQASPSVNDLTIIAHDPLGTPVTQSTSLNNIVKLSGFTRTGSTIGLTNSGDQLLLGNQGVAFTASDSNPTCSSGVYAIYSDLSETKLKKCQNGTVSDLSSSADINDVGDCSSGSCFKSGGTGTNLYFQNATSGSITLQTVTGALGTVTLSLPAVTDTLVARTTTDTLTNKRISPRVVSASDATSVTPAADTADIVTQVNTQSAGTLTMNAPSGTPVAGQKLQFMIKSTNVQTYSWNSIYRGSTDLALPTASSGSTLSDYYLFQYNAIDSKWDILAQNTGF